MAVKLDQGRAEFCSNGLMVIRREPGYSRYDNALQGAAGRSGRIEMAATQYLLDAEVMVSEDPVTGEIIESKAVHRAIVGISRRSLAEALQDACLYPNESTKLMYGLLRADPSLSLMGGGDADLSLVRKPFFPLELDPSHLYLWASVRLKTRRQNRGRTQWEVDYRGRYWQTDDQ